MVFENLTSPAHQLPKLANGAKPDLATLARLCLVSKAFEQLARPMLYRHLLLLRSPGDRRREQPAIIGTLVLLRRSLCSSSYAHTLGLVDSAQHLAALVRKIHEQISGDISIDHDILPLLDACKNMPGVSFDISRPTPETREAIARRGLFASLEQLENLTDLAWQIIDCDLDEQAVLAPLASSRLPQLQDLSIGFMSCMSPHSSDIELWTSNGQGTFPALRRLKLEYTRVNRGNHGQSHAGFTSQDAAARHLHHCLEAFTGNCPSELRLTLMTNLLGPELCSGIPEALVDKVTGLSLAQTMAHTWPADSIISDIGPVSRMRRLDTLTSLVQLHRDTWYSLPASLQTLSMNLPYANESIKLASFLANPGNLPSLRGMLVDDEVGGDGSGRKDTASIEASRKG